MYGVLSYVFLRNCSNAGVCTEFVSKVMFFNVLYIINDVNKVVVDAVNLYRQFIGKYLLSRTNLPLKLTFKTVVRRISSRSVMSIIFNSVQTRKKRRKKPIDK